ncbi:MAG: sulfotransferase domain-containing protein [Flavobacteriales bacterium]|nr:sulfotransferase domain-containing protein [Flavobacteriales bacterium]
MSKNVVWISSYPKSGRTWLKILMESILLYEGESTAINDLKVASTTTIKRDSFDQYFGLKSSDLTLEETWEYKRKYYLNMGISKKSKSFILTHDENLILENKKRLFPLEVTQSVIHIVRNPLSIVASLANHLKISIDESIEIMNSSSIQNPKNAFPATTTVYSKIGSWSSHLKSWINNAPYPVQLIRYEDLVENSLAVLKELFRFLNHEVSEEIVLRAIENTSFQKLALIEKAIGFKEKPSTSAGFFRKGKIDSWKEELTNKQIERVMKDHEAMMRKMGYL